MPMNFKHLKELIDENGELRVPETINLYDFDGPGIHFKLENIGANAFNGLTELKKLFIPANCVNVEWSFYHCFNLAEINVVEANPSYCSLDGVLYTKDIKKLVAYPNAHGKEYHIPEGVEIVDHFAFKSCRNIETIYLSNSVRKIGINALYKCNNLKIVYLPDNFKTLQKHTENANVRCKFVYNGKEYSYQEALDTFNDSK